MISVSVVDWKMWPWASYSERISAALIRLPLWATATGPRWNCRSSGWALHSLELPVVEYRTWPMAAVPASSSLSIRGVNTWLTSPMPVWPLIVWPSVTAMPADSWPRCCWAKMPA